MLKVYQYIFNQIAETPHKKFYQKIWRRFFQILQKILLKISNPIIKTNLYGFPFQVPFSHDLPKNLKKYPNYSFNLLKIALWVNQKYPDTPIIDIGANVGDTAALLRTQLKNAILCIEGNPHFFELLQQNTQNFTGVKPVIQLLGAENTALHSELVIEKGTAQIKNTSEKKSSVKILTTVLQQYPEFLNSKLVKIDTDGFDGYILRGATQWIQDQKPYIFLEFDPYFLGIQQFPVMEIIEIFREKHYELVSFFDNFGNYLTTVKMNELSEIERLVQKVKGYRGVCYYDLLFMPEDDLVDYPYLR